MGVIDADAHVIESERTWSFMAEEDRRFAPELLVSSKNGVEYWRIEERVFPNSNLGLNVPEAARDLTDVAARLAHMDALGVDIQVLYPSLFLRPLTAAQTPSRRSVAATTAGSRKFGNWAKAGCAG